MMRNLKKNQKVFGTWFKTYYSAIMTETKHINEWNTNGV